MPKKMKVSNPHFKDMLGKHVFCPDSNRMMEVVKADKKTLEERDLATQFNDSKVLSIDCLCGGLITYDPVRKKLGHISPSSTQQG
jgi:hypothetical protein